MTTEEIEHFEEGDKVFILKPEETGSDADDVRSIIDSIGERGPFLVWEVQENGAAAAHPQSITLCSIEYDVLQRCPESGKPEPIRIPGHWLTKKN